MRCDPRDWIAVSQVLGPATLAKLTAAGFTLADILSRQLPDTVRLRADTSLFLHITHPLSCIKMLIGY